MHCLDLNSIIVAYKKETFSAIFAILRCSNRTEKVASLTAIMCFFALPLYTLSDCLSDCVLFMLGLFLPNAGTDALQRFVQRFFFGAHGLPAQAAVLACELLHAVDPCALHQLLLLMHEMVVGRLPSEP
jgi:hypothetical protein